MSVNADALSNLLDPAVLFFLLGLLAGAVRSNLEIPPQVAKFLSLYLLMAIGFKGGQELSSTGLGVEGLKVVAIAMVLAVLIPAIGFLVLRSRVDQLDAAAIAATYGSVSAVTFVAASNFVASNGDPAGGYLTVSLVLMESPAIIMAVVLASWVRLRQRSVDGAPSTPGQTTSTRTDGPAVPGPGTEGSGADASTMVDVRPGGPDEPPAKFSAGHVLLEAFTNGANLLLLGSLVIGFLSGSKGGEAMEPFTNDLFKGLLAFFLLEMGLLVSRQLREVRDVGPFLVGFGLVMPLVGASLAMLLGGAAGLNVGDLTVLAVLAASASYIVVPAVVRFAIPEARPSRYLTMALAVTFPFNIVVGIPLYYAVAQAVAG
jgi:hypothetical protein